jgi:hypothetical protein
VWVSHEHLAEVFKVGVRTIERDMAALRLTNVEYHHRGMPGFGRTAVKIVSAKARPKKWGTFAADWLRQRGIVPPDESAAAAHFAVLDNAERPRVDNRASPVRRIVFREESDLGVQNKSLAPLGDDGVDVSSSLKRRRNERQQWRSRSEREPIEVRSPRSTRRNEDVNAEDSVKVDPGLIWLLSDPRPDVVQLRVDALLNKGTTQAEIAAAMAHVAASNTLHNDEENARALARRRRDARTRNFMEHVDYVNRMRARPLPQLPEVTPSIPVKPRDWRNEFQAFCRKHYLGNFDGPWRPWGPREYVQLSNLIKFYNDDRQLLMDVWVHACVYFETLAPQLNWGSKLTIGMLSTKGIAEHMRKRVRGGLRQLDWPLRYGSPERQARYRARRGKERG